MPISFHSISDLPSVEFDGIYRVLGCLPSFDNQFPMFGWSNTVLDESQWQEMDFGHYNPPVKNQGQYSSCVGFSSSTCMEVAWMQSGRPFAGFSPWFIYGTINGGRDAGARISDALLSLKSKGVCPDGGVEPGTIQQNKFPSVAYDDARRFRIFEAYQCGSFEEVCSAITLGFPVALGVKVGTNFAGLDEEGVAPLPKGFGGGHAIAGIGLKRSSKYGWVVKIQNSWGRNFGLGGCCYLRKEHFSAMHPDAFAIQAIFDDPLDDTPEDEVPVFDVNFI